MPPTARMASTGPGSMSSMASADIFAMKPTERMASAKIPAIAPSPHHRDEEQRPHDLVNRSAQRHHESCERVGDGLERRDVERAEPDDGDADDDAEQRAEAGDHEGLERRPGEVGEQIPVHPDELTCRLQHVGERADALPVGILDDGDVDAPCHRGDQDRREGEAAAAAAAALGEEPVDAGNGRQAGIGARVAHGTGLTGPPSRRSRRASPGPSARRVRRTSSRRPAVR